MLDKVIIQGGKEAVPYAKTVTIHEHRAPTDDSLRLCQEMEEKVLQRILCRLQANDNALNFRAIVLLPRIGINHEAVYSFILNGKEINGKIVVRMSDAMTLSKTEIARQIIEDASRHIAIEILQHLDMRGMLG